MKSDDDLNRRIAERLRALRASQGLTLEALAARSGVSRSMISLIERGETSATAPVLDRLASGLGVALVTLFDANLCQAPPQEGGPVRRHGQQSEWMDPGSGYLRRSISPHGEPVRIVEVYFPPGGSISFENAGSGQALRQQVWILSGSMDVASGDQRHSLNEGDCFAMDLDRPSSFHNPTDRTARYAVVIFARATKP